MRFGLRQAAAQVDQAAQTTTTASVTAPGTQAGSLLVATAVIWDSNETWSISGATQGGAALSIAIQSATLVGGGHRMQAAVAFGTGTGSDATITFNLTGGTGGANVAYVLGCYELTFSPYSRSIALDQAVGISAVDTSGGTDISVGNVFARGSDTCIIALAGVNSTDSNLNFSSPTGMQNHYRQNDSNSFIGMDSAIMFVNDAFSGTTFQWAHDNNASDRAAAIVVSLRTVDPIRMRGIGT